MRRTKNECHLEGYVYEHNLKERVSGPNSKTPGAQFIAGDLSIATDDDMMNVIKVYFKYVTPLTKKGQANQTYNVLSNIISGKIGSVMEVGKENAGLVRVDTSVGLNEFPDYKQEGAPMIAAKCNEGGFVHQIAKLGEPKTRATFNTDILITGTTRIEANEERDTPEKVIIKGYVFNFRGEILPVEFAALNPRAMDYFEGLEASPKEPVFTRVQGEQVSKTVTRKITEENAFGEALVKEVPRSQKDFIVNWALPEVYGWDTEDSILASELAEKMSEREIHLAEIRKRSDDYRASKNNAIGTATSAVTTGNSMSVPKDDYDF